MQIFAQNGGIFAQKVLNLVDSLFCTVYIFFERNYKMQGIGWAGKIDKTFQMDSQYLKYFFEYRDLDVDIDKYNYKVCNGFKDTKYLVFDNGIILHYIPKYNLYKIIKQYNCRGYKRISVRDETGKSHQIAVHRLVALLFIPNPQQKEEVNHKDRNKSNNCVENLEWVTKSENELHKWRTQGGMREETKRKIRESHKGGKSYRARKVICIETGKTWDTAKEASFEMKMSQNRVSQVCNSGRALKGLHFKYL